MAAYYNEIDPFAAEWLKELMKGAVIADGEIDNRSIEDVTPSDLAGFTQCHFFAGIGVWSYALRQAGWPDDRPVWTGSCPCQPFSAAGKGNGFADERHLWPAFHWLIEQCRPVTVFGEQVASKDGLAWLDLVSADMEGTGYTVGAVDTCAAGFGAPHIRQRLYWMAYDISQRLQGRIPWGPSAEREDQHRHPGRSGAACGLANAKNAGSSHGGPGSILPLVGFNSGKTCGLADPASPRHDGQDQRPEEKTRDKARMLLSGEERATGRVANANCDGCSTRERNDTATRHGDTVAAKSLDDRHKSARPANGFWRDADWLLCRDGKWRTAQSEIFPLAHGATNRVGILRGAGNAIVAPQAKAFIKAAMRITTR